MVSATIMAAKLPGAHIQQVHSQVIIYQNVACSPKSYHLPTCSSKFPGAQMHPASFIYRLLPPSKLNM
jgi:hypothetical protein